MSHLGVFVILPRQQVQNWLDVCHLMGEKLHEDFITSNLCRGEKIKSVLTHCGLITDRHK